MKRLEIKVCGMRNSDNVKALAELNPDYMGFIFYAKSKRYAESVLDQNLIKDLPQTITKVGVFVNESIERIREICDKYEFSHVQLHGDETAEFCQEVKALGFTVIKAFGIDDDFDFSFLQAYEEHVDLSLIHI